MGDAPAFLTFLQNKFVSFSVRQRWRVACGTRARRCGIAYRAARVAGRMSAYGLPWSLRGIPPCPPHLHPCGPEGLEPGARQSAALVAKPVPACRKETRKCG